MGTPQFYIGQYQIALHRTFLLMCCTVGSARKIFKMAAKSLMRVAA